MQNLFNHCGELRPPETKPLESSRGSEIFRHYRNLGDGVDEPIIHINLLGSRFRFIDCACRDTIALAALDDIKVDDPR